jgi:hypothetical protein
MPVNPPLKGEGGVSARPIRLTERSEAEGDFTRGAGERFASF